MALDPNIAMGFRGLQLNDPMDNYAKAASLSRIGMQNQYMQSRMDESRRLSDLAKMRQQIYAASGGDSDKLLAGLQQAGDMEGVQAYQQHLMSQQKDQADLADKQMGTSGKRLKLISDAAAIGFSGGTMQHAGMVADMLEQNGAKGEADFVRGMMQQYPDASPEQVRAFFKPYISSQLSASELLMPKYEDVGGQKVNVNPNVQVDPLQKTQTPDSVASNAVAREGHQVTMRGQDITMRGQNMTDARSKEANNISKAPAGFRFKADGTLEAIPGGPADVKNEANMEAKRIKEESQATKAGIVREKVDEALSKVGFATSGLTGKAMSQIPGTSAYDLDKTVETIKANLGFKELADMRAASPTGGALGQVAVKELEFLQAAVASLDVGQSEAQLRKNLQKVKRHYDNWSRAVTKAAPKQGGIKFLGFE